MEPIELLFVACFVGQNDIACAKEAIKLYEFVCENREKMSGEWDLQYAIQFLAELRQQGYVDYLESLQINENDRIFPFTKSYMHHEMRRGCKISGVKQIRIHGIRHSHVSLLIDMGFSAVAIADRVGHESIDITYRYAHVFPSTQLEVVSKLNNLMTMSSDSIEK